MNSIAYSSDPRLSRSLVILPTTFQIGGFFFGRFEFPFPSPFRCSASWSLVAVLGRVRRISSAAYIRVIGTAVSGFGIAFGFIRKQSGELGLLLLKRDSQLLGYFSYLQIIMLPLIIEHRKQLCIRMSWLIDQWPYLTMRLWIWQRGMSVRNVDRRECKRISKVGRILRNVGGEMIVECIPVGDGLLHWTSIRIWWNEGWHLKHDC